MKIKIETSRKVTSYKEIKLPYYSRSICHFYKVYSETHCISVVDLTEHESIGIQQSSLALSSENKKSSESEFKKAFDKINTLLLLKLNK
jgi:hypothetical protein